MRDIANIRTRRASIKESGEELSQEDWRRFDAAVAQVKAERDLAERDLVQRSLRIGGMRVIDIANDKVDGRP